MLLFKFIVVFSFGDRHKIKITKKQKQKTNKKIKNKIK